MRVLLVNHRFYPAEGGTERWTLGLAEALLRRGHRVTVLTQGEPGAPSEETLRNVEIRRIPVRHLGGMRVPSGYWRTLRSLDYDILHLSGNRIWCADFYFPVAAVFDTPQVITPHDFYQLAMDPTLLNRLYFGRYLPFQLRSFDLYLALTRSEAARIERFGFPAERVRTVGEGIEVEDFDRVPPPLHIRDRWGTTRPLLALYVGGLWANKRVDRIVRALEPVKERVTLAIVGRDVPGHACDQAHVAALATRLGVEVKFLGPLTRHEVLAAYREADLYLLGAQYEGFGISLGEALSAGVPFAAYDVGAARELAEGGGGLVASSEHEYGEAVSRLVRDDALRTEMGQQAKSSARQWAWDIIVDRYIAAYRFALERRD